MVSPQPPAGLRALDHATTRLELPVRRLSGSSRLNPLPHAGTISVFLLGVVLVSGLYITLFFEYGHVASYRSVTAMEDHAIQRVVRALHRYSSAALVITTVIHGWRIFVAGRFSGRQRRWRWVSGVSSLVLVWLAGVTGYWLIWDTRAQALNEIVLGFVGGTEAGAGFAIDHLGVLGGRSGSGFMLFLWFIHLALSAAISYFVFRHLRRTNLPWFPPPQLMVVMGVALMLVSVAFPLGMLPAAEPDRLVGRIPLDPFVLFLLPPLLSGFRWIVFAGAAALLAVVMILPRLLQRHDSPVIVIDEDACTGCELCVIDCPYQALQMVDRPPGQGSPDRLLAVVDEARCVSCGICLGSCAFEAIELPGTESEPSPSVVGRPVVIACDRHVDRSAASLLVEPPDGVVAPSAVVQPVVCAGAVAPETVGRFIGAGAKGVQLVGCAPNECRYGIGNSLASERLSGDRRPHPPRKLAALVTQDWVPTDRFEPAIADPGLHPSAEGRRLPGGREALLGVGLVATVTAAGAALATRAPFQQDLDEGQLRVVIDHQTGQALQAAPDAGPLGSLSSIEVTVDGASVARAGHDEPAAWVSVLDFESGLLERQGAEPLAVEVELGTADGATRKLSYESSAEVAAGTRLLIDLTDVPVAPTIADGRRIFTSRRGGCDVCHSVEPGDDGVGPSLAGVATTASTRVEGLDAGQYLRQSILLPDQYILDGWPAGQMLPIYRDRLTEEELEAVIAYLLTLEETDEDRGEDS